MSALNAIYGTPRVIAFDDASDADAAAKAAADAEAKAAADAAAAAKATKDEDKLSPAQQAKVDKMLKDQQDAGKRAMAELEALKARTDLTEGQRKDLEARFDNIQKELLTKEELFEQEKKKKDKQFNETVESLTAERDTWKNRYTETNISQAIMDASVKNKAFDSDTIIAILRPNTSLIESLDNEGHPTGKFEPRVKFMDPEGKGGPTELLLPVSEAVKRMGELSKYQYLFEGRGAGGAGMNNGAGGKATDIEKLASDPEAYRKARKEGRILK